MYTAPVGTTNAIMPFGAGKVIYLGWDWFGAAPLGTVDSGWIDVLGRAVEECEAVVAECFLVVGPSRGATDWDAGIHSWPIQLSRVDKSWPVLLDSIPTFSIPAPVKSHFKTRRLVDHFHAQVLMYNPDVFPTNPEQYTGGIEVFVWSDGRVMARHYGARDGMDIWVRTFEDDEGNRFFELPFSIDGL